MKLKIPSALKKTRHRPPELPIEMSRVHVDKLDARNSWRNSGDAGNRSPPEEEGLVPVLGWGLNNEDGMLKIVAATKLTYEYSFKARVWGRFDTTTGGSPG